MWNLMSIAKLNGDEVALSTSNEVGGHKATEWSIRSVSPQFCWRTNLEQTLLQAVSSRKRYNTTAYFRLLIDNMLQWVWFTVPYVPMPLILHLLSGWLFRTISLKHDNYLAFGTLFENLVRTVVLIFAYSNRFSCLGHCCNLTDTW